MHQHPFHDTETGPSDEPFQLARMLRLLSGSRSNGKELGAMEDTVGCPRGGGG